MDVITFNAVVGSVTRLVYRDKSEEAWVKLIAANGSAESMEKLTRAWRSATGDEKDEADAAPAGAKGAAAFLKALKIDPRKGGSF